MRVRSLVGSVAIFTIAGGMLTASPAQAYQLMEPAFTTPPSDVVSVSTIDAATVTTNATPGCPAWAGGSMGSLAHMPALGSGLAQDLARYGRNAPVTANADRWWDSGGAFGGGVPEVAVGAVMRRGLANGLTEDQVRSFLNPAFLRGMNDPRGGAWLFRFVAQSNDPTFYQALASYAQSRGAAAPSPIVAQADVFEAFPVLQAAYVAQAGAIPASQDAADQLVQLANQGYAPARRTVDAIVASGNHPSAGAQNAGGVGNGIRPYIYDYLVVNYRGPLSRGARSAVANRGAYMSWVDRIAAWESNGYRMSEVPDPAVFPAPAGSVATTAVAVPGC
ncbi:MAG: hypothetical protein ACRDH7_01470 [Actinomycetota bacterium]